MVWALTSIMVISALSQLTVVMLGARMPAALYRPFAHLHWLIVPGFWRQLSCWSSSWTAGTTR
ncbi:hypothetical protein [Nesterenkonia flava]|uniref:Uncharacterized protein n=1 Tax=Nesterenkonia flava TaxID=469799 RepID=A0ABU1FUV8_9MICC|nr:hypothetical protein [Nesterenkonia flava]MDR5712444.1 hypothetical protein [Nesterenkonia flava]